MPADAQESHEAVRPVDIRRTPRELRGQLEQKDLALYELIWRRALASQMANAVYDQLALLLEPSGGGGGEGGGSEARA